MSLKTILTKHKFCENWLTLSEPYMTLGRKWIYFPADRLFVCLLVCLSDFSEILNERSTRDAVPNCWVSRKSALRGPYFSCRLQMKLHLLVCRETVWDLKVKIALVKIVLYVSEHSVCSLVGLRKGPQITYSYSFSYFFSHGSTALSERRAALWGVSITLRHATLGRAPLDEWSTRRSDLY